jgi:hypothetical protein
MPDDDRLTPATDAELVSALAYGLRFDERGRAHRLAAELTARIAAETLARYLARAGFVVMKRPPARAPSTGDRN